jgi:signal peptidase I
MVTPLSALPRTEKYAYGLSLIFGILGLGYIFIAPVPGVLMAGNFIVAWGIRRHYAAAAWMSAGQYAVSLFLEARWLFDPSPNHPALLLLLTALFNLACIWVFLAAALHMQRDPRRAGPDWPWFAWLAASAAYAVAIGAYQMPSASMEKTLLPGDYLLVDRLSFKLGREPDRDTLIVFRYPLNHRENYIKRVAGIPGDRLRIEHKRLYRNGQLVSEPYATHATSYEDAYRDNFPSAPNTPLPEPALRMLREAGSSGEIMVPRGRYFVLGDNRDDSADSRYWGFVSRDELIGRPFLIYASYHLAEPSDPGAVRSVLNTRWNRLLKVL